MKASNSQLSTIIFDSSTRRGRRVWGKAEVLDSGCLFDFIPAEFAFRGTKIRHPVKIGVKEAGIFWVVLRSWPTEFNRTT